MLVFEILSSFQGQDGMPGTKSRTKRRKKRWACGPTSRKPGKSHMELNVKQTLQEVQEQWSQWGQLRCFIPQSLMACVTSVSDGYSKTHSMLLQQQPYGKDHLVEKMDCVSHVQKRMGTALRNLKTQYRGQKLADGKTIGGVGRLTDKAINSLQNYYGNAIRRNKGDVQAMMKAVQETLLHTNSTNEHPRHHLCPVGPVSV